MNPAHSTALAQVLAAPWQQRRNGQAVRGLLLVVALCGTAPGVLYTASLFCEPSMGDRLRWGAILCLTIGGGAIVLVGWAMLVGNLLLQNHPTLARLVPGHVGRLRSALLAAWAALVLFAAAGPGFLLDAPAAWACAAAACLALFAAMLRWPLLWLSLAIVPFAGWKLGTWSGRDELVGALHAQWLREDWLVTAIVVTAGAVTLVLMIRGGGNRHLAGLERRARLNDHGGASASDAPLAPGLPAGCWRGTPSFVTRPYAWWFRRQLARADSPVMSRLLLGLGPAVHWTTRISDSLWAWIFGGAMSACAAWLAGPEIRGTILAWAAFGLLTGMSTPALQALPRLGRTAREQALLALLPGVPHGARLNRWLGWQMSLPLVWATLCGLVLARALNRLAEAVEPGVVDRATGGMSIALMAALLPQLAWQWRRWSHLRASSAADLTLPVLSEILLAMLALVLHATTGVGYLALGAGFTAVSLAYCAWRWWRMDREATAFPMGRLRPGA
ncbi:MAG: hypothetical protein JF586_13635 [Burkholderiales bacterium]|nr:hypothetical protein [Burkholderiales bacterium]